MEVAKDFDERKVVLIEDRTSAVREDPCMRLDGAITVEYDAGPGRDRLVPSQASCELRIVGGHRAAPDEDGIVFLPQCAAALASGTGGDPTTLSSDRGQLAVQRPSRFQKDQRQALGYGVVEFFV